MSEENNQRPSPVLRRRRLVSRNSEAGTKRTGSLRIERRMVNRAVMGNSVVRKKSGKGSGPAPLCECVKKDFIAKAKDSQ